MRRTHFRRRPSLVNSQFCPNPVVGCRGGLLLFILHVDLLFILHVDHFSDSCSWTHPIRIQKILLAIQKCSNVRNDGKGWGHRLERPSHQGKLSPEKLSFFTTYHTDVWCYISFCILFLFIWFKSYFVSIPPWLLHLAWLSHQEPAYNLPIYFIDSRVVTLLAWKSVRGDNPAL